MSTISDQPSPPDDGRPVEHKKDSPSFIQWLLKNFRLFAVIFGSFGVVAIAIYKLAASDTLRNSAFWSLVLFVLLIWLQTTGPWRFRRPWTEQVRNAAGGQSTKPGREPKNGSFKRLEYWVERNAGLNSLISGVGATAFLAFYTLSDNDIVSLLVAFWIAFSVFTLTLIFLFTRTLPHPKPSGVDPDSDINALFRVSYAFVAIVVVMAGTFLVSPHIFRAQTEEHDGTDRTKRALAIVKGCDYASPGSHRGQATPIIRSTETKTNPDGTTEIVKRLKFAPGESSAEEKEDSDDSALPVEERIAAMPEGAHCGDIPPQWVLSIGGNILDCHINGTCWAKKYRYRLDKSEKADNTAKKSNSSGDTDTLATESKGKVKLDRGPCPFLREQDISTAPTCYKVVDKYKQLRLDRARLQAKIRQNRSRLYEIELEKRAMATIEPKEEDRLSTSLAKMQGKLNALDKTISKYEPIVRQIDRADAKNKWRKALIQNVAGAPIIGGIVIPIYFLAVAVLGACIGMVRKLPEYQYRSTTEYRDNYDPLRGTHSTKDEPLEKGEARDVLIFQSMQVMFSPAVALIAYSFARPDDVATAVVLAFAAGYSSEIFLVVIRDLSDRLIGLGLRPARYARTATLKSKSTSLIGHRVALKRPLGTYGVGSIGEIVGIEDGSYIAHMYTDERKIARADNVKAKSLSFFRDLDKPRSE